MTQEQFYHLTMIFVFALVWYTYFRTRDLTKEVRNLKIQIKAKQMLDQGFSEETVANKFNMSPAALRNLVGK